jgi:DNA-binding NarL/FixJ family response regulator
MTYERQPGYPAPAQRAHIVIVDDHDLAWAGLRSMLAQERDLTVVGEISDGAQALALCRRLAPNLILMDVGMPGLDGLVAATAIKQE